MLKIFINNYYQMWTQIIEAYNIYKIYTQIHTFQLKKLIKNQIIFNMIFLMQKTLSISKLQLILKKELKS